MIVAHLINAETQRLSVLFLGKDVMPPGERFLR